MARSWTTLLLAVAAATTAPSCDGGGGDEDAGPPPDLTIDVVWPEEGSPASGAVTIVAEVEPVAEVLGVEFAFVEGGAERRFDTDLSAPYESVVDSTALTDGPARVRVTAVGRRGQTASDELSLLVDNQVPVVEIVEPAAGAVAFVEDGTFEVVVRASDGSGIESLTLTADGAALAPLEPGAEDLWTGTLDMSGYAAEAEGRLLDVELEAVATDPFDRSARDQVSLGIAERLRWVAVLPTVVESGAARSPDGAVAYVATRAGEVHALSMADGSEVCRSSAAGDGFQGPAVSPDGSAVYFGTSTGLRAIAGAPSCGNLWTARPGEIAQGTPTVEPVTGTIFFTTRTSDEGRVHAASPTGAVLWTRSDAGLLRSGPTLVPDRRLVVVSSADHYLHALAIDDSGRPVDGFAWSAETGGEIEASAVLDRDRLYVGSEDMSLYAFSAADGARIWDAPFPTERRISSVPAVDRDGYVYVTSRDGSCYRLSPDRVLDWEHTVPSGISYSSPVVEETAGLVLFCETGMTGADGLIHGVLHAVDRGSGEALWSSTLDGTCEATPLVIDGTAVVGTHAGLVYAYFVDSAAARRVLDPGDG